MDLLLVNPANCRTDYVTEHLGIASLQAYLSAHGFKVEGGLGSLSDNSSGPG